MSLTNQIKDVLRSGSLRDERGSDAANVLASRLGRKKRDVIAALSQMIAEDQIEVQGSLDHCRQVSLKREFVPMSTEGRRQKLYAVDQKGRGYKSIATGGPVTVYKSLEDWVNAGNDPAKYPFGTPEETSQDQQQATEPVAEQAPAIKPKRKQAKRVDSAPQRQRLENIEKLKQLIEQEACNAENGLVPARQFKTMAAATIAVGVASIDAYMGELVKAGYIEFVKNAYQGESNFRLVTKKSSEQKFNDVLVLLRTLKKKRSRRSLVEEVAELLGTTTKSAQASFLSPLIAVGAYRTEKDTSTPKWKFKLVYVQDGPLTPEQMESIRAKRRNAKKIMATKQLAPVVSQPEVIETPAASAVPVDQDEITELIRDLVETNEEQVNRIRELEEALAHQVDINSAQVRMIQELDDQILANEIMLEAERARSLPPQPAKPIVPDDLLSRARAVVAKREASSTES